MAAVTTGGPPAAQQGRSLPADASADATATTTSSMAAGPHISPPGMPYSSHELQMKFVDLTPRDVYALLCKRSGCKPVSTVSTMLPDKASVWDIQELNLSKTYVGHRGVVPIAELCKLLDSLKVLILSDNYLTNKSVWHVCKMAAFHPTLHTLDVSANDVTWTAGMSLLELAAINPRITVISVAGTALKPKVMDTIAAQLRKNAMSGSRPARRGHVPTNHPLSVRQRSLKRFFREAAAKEAGGHQHVGAGREGRAARAVLAEGYRELLRLSGRETDIAKKPPAFFDAFVRRASGDTVDWEEFMLLVMLEDVTFDARQVEHLRTVFAHFDSDQGGYVLVADLPEAMSLAYGGVVPRPEEVAAMRDFYQADDTMTLSWDEMLLMFYDHGPSIGRLSSFHTHTPLKRLKR